jgi:uncharacterized integral membrane protein
MALFRWILGAVFVALCVVFALSNRNLIELQFWPTPYALPVQTGVAVLLPVFIAFLLGALWMSLGKARLWARLRQAEKRADALEGALQATEDRLEHAEAALQAAEDAPADDEPAALPGETVPQLPRH